MKGEEEPKRKPCGVLEAHKEHPWETSKGKARQCPGVRVHHKCMIGKGVQG